jgi:hypothetical protein
MQIFQLAKRSLEQYIPLNNIPWTTCGNSDKITTGEGAEKYLHGMQREIYPFTWGDLGVGANER